MKSLFVICLLTGWNWATVVLVEVATFVMLPPAMTMWLVTTPCHK